MSPGILCISFSSILSHYFSGKGMQKIQLTANLSGLVVTVISAWALIHQFGIYGACLAASLSYATQALVLTRVFFKHHHFNRREIFGLFKDLSLINGRS
jgi:O-antigen/teichoic acid export membrane protein